MSRSQKGTQTAKVKSPVKKYINFNGSSGKFIYWNGTENVESDKLEFVLLDTRLTVTGWSEEHKDRIWSNQVKSAKDHITVRVGKVVIADGPWADIKDTVKAAGGNLTRNIYGLSNDDIICLQVDKGCLFEWSNFITSNGIYTVYDKCVSVEKGLQQKKGAVKYHTTAFSLVDATEDMLLRATDVDGLILQPYLTGEKPSQEEQTIAEHEMEDIPF